MMDMWTVYHAMNMTYGLDFYVQRNAALKQKQSIVKALRREANGIRGVAFGVYGMMCFICTCFSKCANTTLDVAKFGGYWINALKVYETYDTTLVNTLFRRAIAILQRKEQYVLSLRDSLTARSQMQLTIDPAEKLQIIQTLTRLSDDSWFREVLEECMPHTSNGENIIPMNSDEVIVLQAAYPLFYAAVQEHKRIYSPFSIQDRSVTVHALQKYLMNMI